MRAAGAFVPVVAGFTRHRKTRRLARALGLPAPIVVGLLVALWDEVLTQEPDGELDRWTDEDLESAAGWPEVAEILGGDGAEGAFAAALVESGFLEALEGGGWRVHDWHEYAGGALRKAETRLEAKRRRDARRKRVERFRASLEAAEGDVLLELLEADLAPGIEGNTAEDELEEAKERRGLLEAEVARRGLSADVAASPSEVTFAGAAVLSRPSAVRAASADVRGRPEPSAPVRDIEEKRSEAKRSPPSGGPGGPASPDAPKPPAAEEPAAEPPKSKPRRSPGASHASLEAVLGDKRADGRTWAEFWEETYGEILDGKEFRPDLGDELLRAWDHRARRKAKDMPRYLGNWLREEARKTHEQRKRNPRGRDDARRGKSPWSGPAREDTEGNRIELRPDYTWDERDDHALANGYRWDQAAHDAGRPAWRARA